VSAGRIELHGKNIVTSLLLSDDVDGAVLGLSNLTSLCYRFDPVNDALIETELLLM
jgi:predicted aspartyl protease